MKDGAEFAGYEWCLTEKYDANNAEHRAIKKGIEEGDALPDIWYEADVVDALKQAGFEVVERARSGADVGSGDAVVAGAVAAVLDVAAHASSARRSGAR